MSKRTPPPTPPELDEWVEQLRGDHVSPTAVVRVALAEDALRRAYQFPSEYTRCMELVDRHLKAAQEADRAWSKKTIKKLKARREKGDKLADKLGKLGRPRVVEA